MGVLGLATMFEKLFKPKNAYIQVFKDRFSIYCGESKKLFIVDGSFSHPRMLLGDFLLAEKILKEQIKQQDIFSSSGNYRVIVHPKELLEGGLSFLEYRAFQELFIGLGFRQVCLWENQDLSDEEIKIFDWKN